MLMLEDCVTWVRSVVRFEPSLVVLPSRRSVFKPSFAAASVLGFMLEVLRLTCFAQGRHQFEHVLGLLIFPALPLLMRICILKSDLLALPPLPCFSRSCASPPLRFLVCVNLCLCFSGPVLVFLVYGSI